MIVVCNTSSLILLAKLDRLHLLVHLYADVFAPVAVLDEIKVKSGQETTRIEAFVAHGAVHVQETASAYIEELSEDLGAGERAAIALAVEKRADLVILDDQQGRRAARSRDISVTGTIGVLIEAYWKDLIPSIRSELDRLIEAGMWIDEAFYHRLLQEFDD